VPRFRGPCWLGHRKLKTFPFEIQIQHGNPTLLNNTATMAEDELEVIGFKTFVEFAVDRSTDASAFPLKGIRRTNVLDTCQSLLRERHKRKLYSSLALPKTRLTARRMSGRRRNKLPKNDDLPSAQSSTPPTTTLHWTS